ncbi:DUF2254 domain-containing protein [Lysobacter korlensis]|uniref:DUF2254 domain-containing protein n=1 Tax=Lysobacter korlensis TaxID=553636 RepID=A0ABV6RTU0_9GAMM
MTGILPAGKLKQLSTSIRSSFWFVPGVMMLAFIALALGLVEVDQQVDDTLRKRWPRMFAAEAEGSRAMLSAIASSMITVAGVVFSITIVALAQASTQYTSRVLRNFMRDRANQVVLGVFVGVYTYCLLVLRTISGGSNGQFVPSLAVVGGLVLSIVAIGFLIFFIHHIASTIQAGEIARSVMRDTLRSIDGMFPAELGHEAREPATPPSQPPANLTWHPVPATTTGYVQSIDPDALLKFAQQHQVVVRMEVGVGDFAMEQRPLASVSGGRPPDEKMTCELNLLYAIDTYRTTDRDPLYGIRQLVDVSLKALSPGINDTTTAIICLDHLSVILQRLANRMIESPFRSEDSVLRVIACGPTFQHTIELAFGQILENAAGNTSVLARMLRVIEQVAAVTRSPERRALLERRVDVIEELGLESAKTTTARETIERHSAAARYACRAPAGPQAPIAGE